MPAERAKKVDIEDREPVRPMGWLSPFDRMEEMFDEFVCRPNVHPPWTGQSRMPEEFAPVTSVDIYEDGDVIVLKSDLPGMAREDIDVSLTDQMITLSGEKKREENIERNSYLKLERTSGAFKRSFALPSDVQASHAEVSFKNGVLEIRIPKTTDVEKGEREM